MSSEHRASGRLGLMGDGGRVSRELCGAAWRDHINSRESKGPCRGSTVRVGTESAERERVWENRSATRQRVAIMAIHD